MEQNYCHQVCFGIFAHVNTYSCTALLFFEVPNY
jgi:hypothetical protein